MLWPTSVVLTWAVAQSIANQPYDRELSETARALAQQALVSRDHLHLSAATLALLRSEPDDTVLYPGHGPATTIGRERASNPVLLDRSWAE